MAEELGSAPRALPAASCPARGWIPRTTCCCRCIPGSGSTSWPRCFAPDIASRDLVCLGQGPTATRRSSPSAPFQHRPPGAPPGEDGALGAEHGLHARPVRRLHAGTPAINDYLRPLLGGDPYFAGKGFRLLREVAAIGYRNPLFESPSPRRSPYRKMLAALWRESPVPPGAPASA